MKKIGKRVIKQNLALPSMVVLLTLISCSSSSSPSTPSTDEPFTNPTDAQTLQAALTTSPSLEQSTKFWECVVDVDNRTLRYQLVEGGRGLEIDAAATNRQSSFSWQTLSATSMSTQADGQSEVQTFSEIAFSGKNSVRMRLASANLTLQCQRRGEQAPPMPTPSGGSSINYEGVAYPLTHAIERPFNPIPSPGDSHLGAEYKFADAEFFIIPVPVGSGGVINIWEPAGETVQLKADIYHPGTEPFGSAEFRHVPDSVDEQDSEVAGVAFFNDARLRVDINQDGTVEGDDEFIDVIGGTINITRLGNSVNRVSVNLDLANGTVVTGFYEGLVLLRSSDGV